MRIAIGLLIIALLALAGTGWYSHLLAGDLQSANQIIGTLSTGIESRDAAISRLQSESAEREKSELVLRVSLGEAGAAARGREVKIQRLISENETFRNWVTTALPGVVVRLQERPAFASANDYLRWMSEGNKLSVPSEPAAK